MAANFSAGRFDNVWFGAILGIIAPCLTLYGFFLFKYGDRFTFSEFYYEILLANQIFTAILSLCVITNLLVFFIFIWTSKNYSARGVLLSTMLYGMYVVYQKYIK